MKIFKDFYINSLYKRVLSEVLKGIKISPRGIPTLEFKTPVCMILQWPYTNFIVDKVRCIPPKFIFAELYWILSGRNDLKSLFTFNKKMLNYSDDDKTLYGAYGKRLYEQYIPIIEKLKKDIYSRQGIMTIIRPEDAQAKTKDFPCNNLLNFRVRNNKLDLTIYVRSQDLWLGFPIDIVHWTNLHYMISKILNLEVGNIYNIVNSLHLYESNIEDAKRFLDRKNKISSFLFVLPQVFLSNNPYKFFKDYFLEFLHKLSSDKFITVVAQDFEDYQNRSECLNQAYLNWLNKWSR